jgi:hypothetical protein
MRNIPWIVGGFYLILFLIGELSCPIGFCRGSDMDAWMMPFFLGVFGLPVALLLGLIYFITRFQRR